MDTIIDLLERAVADHARRPALIIKPGFRTRIWTYADIGHHVPRVAQVLRGAGVQPGDRVLIWAVNRPEWGIGFLARCGRGRCPCRPTSARPTSWPRRSQRRPGQAGARLDAHHQGRQPTRAPGAGDRVTRRRRAERAAAPPPRGRSGQAGGDRLHLGHDRRPEGRHAQPPNIAIERGVAGERGSARARDAPAVDPAALAHVRAEPRLPGADAGRRIGRVSDQPPATGAGANLPGAEGDDAAGGAAGREAAQQRRRAAG